MPRRYRVTAEQLALTAAEDMLQIKGAAGKILRIIEVGWSNTDNTLATAQQLSTRCRFLPTTVTDGSGGGSATIKATDPGDAAASFTALYGNTTKASTNGTAAILYEGGGYIYAGERYTFPSPPIVGPSESFVWELLSSAIQGTVHANIWAEVEELGG